jgi:hypothetical protein
MNRWRTFAFISTLLLVIGVVGQTAHARGGGGCLEEGTPVATPAGPVAVERIGIGDQVLSVIGNHTAVATVQARLRVEAESFVELSIDGRSTILRLTEEHPVQTDPGVFVEAGRLRPGDSVWIDNGDGKLTVARLSAVRRIALHRPAYNLLVSPGGTYLAAGIVVHNKGCFLPETPVLLANGSELPISDVRAGMELMAFRPDGTVTSAAVADVIVCDADAFLIVSTDKVTLRVTPEHPFYVGDGTFKTIAALTIGDRVFAFDGHGLSAQTITGIEHVRQSVKVYNLQTDEPHTFFAHGIAVHNKGGGGGGGHGGGGGTAHGFSASHAVSVSPSFNTSHSAFVPHAVGGAQYYGGSTIPSSDGYPSSSNGYMPGGGTLSRPSDDASGFVCPVVAGLLIAGLALKAILGRGGASRISFAGSDENLDYVHPRSAVAPKAEQTQRVLAQLAADDPGIDPSRLADQAKATFLKLQHCWESQDYAPMRPLLMPDLWQQHLSQIQAMRRHNEINRIEGCTVQNVDLVNVRYTKNPAGREFVALITARARDYYVDSRSGKFLRGDTSPSPFQEFWTFHWLDNGWRLREIEQSRESDALARPNVVEGVDAVSINVLQGGAAAGPPGPWADPTLLARTSRVQRLLDKLALRDPLWDRFTMTERARDVVLRTLLASERGDPSAIPTVDLFPAAAADVSKRIQQQIVAGTKLQYRNLCIRKVDLVLVRNFKDNSRDEFLARISAHAQQTITRNGQVVRQDDDVRPLMLFCTFGRNGSVWKLKEILPENRGRSAMAAENIDEDGLAAGSR